MIYLTLLTIGSILLNTFQISDGKFTVYWNAPSHTCEKYDIYLDLDKYSIVHNTGGSFNGDKMNILYLPGRFPYYTADEVAVNGGIPQLGNLSEHVAAFIARVEEHIPTDYSGPMVLDFEKYLPDYDAAPKLYKDKSIEWVKTLHPEWSSNKLKAEAQVTFDEGAKAFVKVLIDEGLRLRPNALWGYYYYPPCNKYQPPFLECNPKISELNDEMEQWLYNATTAFYPSLYTYKVHSALERRNILSTKVKEAQRVNSRNVPVLSYFWYRYHDDDSYLPAWVAKEVLEVVVNHDSAGLVVWGASADFNNKQACLNFQTYLDDTLGPMLKHYHDLYN